MIKTTRGYARPKLAMMIAAGTAGLVAAGIVGAGPANADQVQDDQFVATVQQMFPGQYLNRGVMLSNAHKTCDNLAGGSTVDAEVAAFMKGNPENTLAQAQAVTHAAVSAYCPQLG
jgi:hypothetical protein